MSKSLHVFVFLFVWRIGSASAVSCFDWLFAMGGERGAPRNAASFKPSLETLESRDAASVVAGGTGPGVARGNGAGIANGTGPGVARGTGRLSDFGEVSQPRAGARGSSNAPSPASFAPMVQQIYAEVLERVGGPAEVSGWANYAATSGIGAARALIATSAEAAARIDGLYSLHLGRSADPGGLQGWQAFLSGGGSLHQVREGILASAEGLSRSVPVLYESILQRQASTAEVDQWIGVGLRTGSFQTVRSGIAQSAEAAARIDDLYVQNLGRHADPSGLSGWQSFMATGGTLEGVRLQIMQSAEYRAARGQ